MLWYSLESPQQGDSNKYPLSIKSYVVGIHLNRLAEVILMRSINYHQIPTIPVSLTENVEKKLTEVSQVLQGTVGYTAIEEAI